MRQNQGIKQSRSHITVCELSMDGWMDGGARNLRRIDSFNEIDFFK